MRDSVKFDENIPAVHAGSAPFKSKQSLTELSNPSYR